MTTAARPATVVHLGEWDKGNAWFRAPSAKLPTVSPNVRDMLRSLGLPTPDITWCWGCDGHELPLGSCRLIC